MIGPLHAVSSPDGANKPRPLEGRFVLVVGASSEAGSACVDHFRQEGAKVIPAGMMYSVFERGFPWLTGNEVGLGVCDEDSWEAVVQLIEKACSHLDVVVNCAPFTFEVTGRSDRTTWAGRAGKHVQSVQATMAACMPLLGKSGRGCLINVIAQPHPDQLDTWESWPARAAMLAMTKLGAVTGTDDQTRVNAVSVDNWGSLKTSGQLDAVDLSHCVPEAATADAPTAIALAAGFLASQGVEGFNGVDLLVKPNQRQPLKQ